MKITIEGHKSEVELAKKINNMIDELISEEIGDDDLESVISEMEETDNEDLESIIRELMEEQEEAEELKPYQKRMQKEYRDLKRRFERLRIIINREMNDILEFELDSPMYLLEKQLDAMREYLLVLEARAEIEGVPLD